MMAIVTKNSRLNKINAEYENLSRAWTNIADVMTRELPNLKNFAAWRNEMFLTDSGDIDIEDMAEYKAQFDAIFGKLVPSMIVLNELNDMASNPPEQFKVDNDAFIAKYGLNMAEYDKKFK